MFLAKQELHPLKTIKTTTIPKLEIEAAVLGAELAAFVRSEMTAHIDRIQF